MIPTTPPRQAVRYKDVTAPALVALDIDGTLLETGGDVPPVTAAAVAAVREAGHRIVLATGRSLVGVLPVAQSLGLDDSWVVASNGAVVARLCSTEPAGYTLHERRTFDVDPVVHLARSHIADVLIGVEEVGWGWRVSETFDDGRLNGRQHVVRHLDELWATPVTRLIVAAPGADALLDPLHQLEVTASPVGSDWVDVTPRGLSKASALETIRARLDVPADRTVAVGDGLNDAEMLAWAAYAVAMGHAPDPIKALADHITGTIHEQGAASVLQALVEDTTLLRHQITA